MRERLYTFGEANVLNGIASIPEDVKYNTCIILSNSGVMHKTGPFDMNTQLSRTLAKQGFLVFRFDLSGLGDSGKVPGKLTYHQTVVRDMRAAMDLMESHFKPTRFVLIGLCTGAENSYITAMEDSRVAGLTWLDGYGYDNTKGRLIRFARRLKNAFSISKLLEKLRQSPEPLPDSPVTEDDYFWTLPARQELADGLNLLHQRGLKFLNIYSGGVAVYNAYENQFADTFSGEPFLQSMEVEFFSQADHTYKVLKDRELLIKRIAQWLQQFS